MVTRNQGYQLVVNPHDFDRFQFNDLAMRGREAVAEGEDERGSELFAGALALWRGPALADVQAGQLRSTHLVELEEARKGCSNSGSRRTCGWAGIKNCSTNWTR